MSWTIQGRKDELEAHPDMATHFTKHARRPNGEMINVNNVLAEFSKAEFSKASTLYKQMTDNNLFVLKNWFD